MNRLATYIRETRGELRHVSWPTRKQAATYTVIVVLVSLAVAAYLGALDVAFTRLIQFAI